MIGGLTNALSDMARAGWALIFYSFSPEFLSA